MTTEQTRTALVLMLTVVIAAGLYLGWHFTHQPSHRCVTNYTSGLHC